MKGLGTSLSLIAVLIALPANDAIASDKIDLRLGGTPNGGWSDNGAAGRIAYDDEAPGPANHNTGYSLMTGLGIWF